MKWASAISGEPSLAVAVADCAREVRNELGPGEVSLAMVFVTPHFAARFAELHALVSDALGGPVPEVFIGCSGGGVIGGEAEIEGTPALSLVAARLPDVGITPFRIPPEKPLPDLDGPPDAWERLIGADPEDTRALILLSDPFSSQTQTLLAGLDFAYPDSPKVGGLVSGGTSPGTNGLFLGPELFTDGLVGLALSGNVSVETVVAQGCKPIGDLLSVTACEGNVLYELDETPALEAARKTLASLDERDARLAQSALFVGVVMDEFVDEPGPGEFLVRNVLGADPANGSLAVGEYLQQGMRLKFHVRDAETSAEDLSLLLDGYANATERPTGSPGGAVLFSCLGRGENLYGVPNFDSDLFRRKVGDMPVGGFFCNGEIGPVGDSTFLHGYTSSFAVFSPRNPA